MKKSFFLTIALLTVSIGLIFVFTACGKKSSSAGEIKPFTESSFSAVTAQLDPGGSFYLYAGTDQLVKWANDLFAFLLDPKISATMGEHPEKAVAGIRWIQSLLTDSGLMAVDGIGISTVPLAEDLHHSTLVIHRGKRSTTDLISQLTQDAENPLEILSRLPEDTVLASFSDHSLVTLWKWLDRHIRTSGYEELNLGWSQFHQMMASAQIDLEKLLGSLGRQIGMVITLDQTQTFPIPGSAEPLNFPVPGLAIVIDTRNSMLFELLHKALPKAEMKEEGGRKTLSMPRLPMPFELSLHLRQTDKRLIIASSTVLLDQFDTAAPNGRSLKDSDEFKGLSRHMPTKGNGFRYLSPRLWSQLSILITQQMGSSAQPSAVTGKEFLGKMLPAKLSFYSVVRHQGDSINIKMNHSFPAGHMILVPAVAGVGIVSAIAIPNLIKAREKASQLNQNYPDQPGSLASDLDIDVPEDPDIE